MADDVSSVPLPRSRCAVFLALAVLGCACDLISKRLMFDWLGGPNPPVDEWFLIPGVLSLTTSLNEGALFGFGQGQQFVFIVLSLAAAVSVVLWLFVFGAARDWWLTVAMGLVAGGIVGNLYDRLGLPGLTWQQRWMHRPHEVGAPVYAVRDWIHFKIEGVIDWPVFNIADSLLVCGAALLLWHAFLIDAPHRNREPTATEKSPATGA